MGHVFKLVFSLSIQVFVQFLFKYLVTILYLNLYDIIPNEEALTIHGGAFLQLKYPIYTALRGMSGSVGLIEYLVFILVNFLFQLKLKI